MRSAIQIAWIEFVSIKMKFASISITSWITRWIMLMWISIRFVLINVLFFHSALRSKSESCISFCKMSTVWYEITNFVFVHYLYRESQMIWDFKCFIVESDRDWSFWHHSTSVSIEADWFNETVNKEMNIRSIRDKHIYNQISEAWTVTYSYSFVFACWWSCCERKADKWRHIDSSVYWDKKFEWFLDRNRESLYDSWFL